VQYIGAIMSPKAITLAMLALLSLGVAKRVLHQGTDAGVSQEHAEFVAKVAKFVAKGADTMNAEASQEQVELATSEAVKDADAVNTEASQEQVELTTNGVSQEQIELATKEAEGMMADADFRKRLQEIEEEVNANPESQKELEAYAEELSADPDLQKQVASMQEQIKAMKAKQPSPHSLLEVSENSDTSSSMWQRFAMLLLASEDAA